MTVTLEHKLDSQQMEADAYVDLFEIRLYPEGVMYVCPTQSVFWQGNLYEYWGVQLTGVGNKSDEETARPKFSIANFAYNVDQEPIKGVFSALNVQNKIEGGTVIRRRLLKTHLDNDEDIKIEMRWRVARIASLRRDIITLELRNYLDGPRFTIPARKFMPPEFPQVSLY